MLYSILPVLVLLGFASRSFARHVYFEVTFSWGAGAPDGQVRDLIYINGQFPGPPFVLDYGDDVEVRRCLACCVCLLALMGFSSSCTISYPKPPRSISMG